MKRPFMKIFFFFALICMSASTAFAGQYDLKKITPEVDRALKSRQARYAQVQNLKQAGVIGETNKGLLAVMGQDSSAAVIVRSENEDRQVIYQALVDQNALGPAGMPQVQKAFAEVQKEKAAPGDYIQTADGKWSRKE